MAYAKLNGEGRILMWSNDRVEGYDAEFSNGSYVDERCVAGLEDFRIVNGEAVYDPKPEKEIAGLKESLNKTDYVALKALDAIVVASDLSGLLSGLRTVRETYAQTFRDRAAWRERINEIERG